MNIYFIRGTGLLQQERYCMRELLSSEDYSLRNVKNERRSYIDLFLRFVSVV
jgi:hypothetical protein